MRKSAGFTLIELVIVIIILGILGAVAAPRLFNLQGDAYGANLNALKSSISTAATMANAKAQIQGVMDADGTTDDGVVNEAGVGSIKGYDYIEFVNGYPAANKEVKGITGKPAGILATLDGFEAERYNLNVNASGDKLTITPKSIDKADITDADADDKDISNDACVVIYTVPEKVGESFKIDAYTGGC